MESREKEAKQAQEPTITDLTEEAENLKVKINSLLSKISQDKYDLADFEKWFKNDNKLFESVTINEKTINAKNLQIINDEWEPIAEYSIERYKNKVKQAKEKSKEIIWETLKAEKNRRGWRLLERSWEGFYYWLLGTGSYHDFNSGSMNMAFTPEKLVTDLRLAIDIPNIRTTSFHFFPYDDQKRSWELTNIKKDDFGGGFDRLLEDYRRATQLKTEDKEVEE